VPNPKDLGKTTVPTKFPDTTPPVPSGDYSYVLEIVMNMQTAMGRLQEAVESLKDQSKEQGKEIRDIAKDIHAAKVTGKVLLWVVGVVGALLGIFIAAYARQVFAGATRP
jgi:hypothetical protein